MKDCRLVLKVRDENVKMESDGVSVVELAELSGILQILAAEAAISKGVDIEEVRNNMLDIHLAAMEQVVAHLKEQKGGDDGSADKEGNTGAAE